jgi:hypothetical protein
MVLQSKEIKGLLHRYYKEFRAGRDCSGTLRKICAYLNTAFTPLILDWCDEAYFVPYVGIVFCRNKHRSVSYVFFEGPL